MAGVMLRPLRRRPPRSSCVRLFSTSRQVRDALRIGYVPEHFSTPLHFASSYFDLNATLIPFPSGTGHMVQSLEAKELDVGIGLTEGWVAGLQKANAKDPAKELPYKLVGTYVETPLCWAISTGARRDDVGSVEQLKGKKVGVSRIGSGSYVMSFVLADQHGWLDSPSSSPPALPFEPVVLHTFKNLRDAVDDGTADFFMWEHFTSKRYYDNGDIRRVGEIYTPWPSWQIVARDAADTRLVGMFTALDRGIAHFTKHEEEAVDYISTELDYSPEDAQEWLKTVVFAQSVRGVDPLVVRRTLAVLGKAGVFDANAKIKAAEMIGLVKHKSAEVRSMEETPTVRVRYPKSKLSLRRVQSNLFRRV